MTTARIRPVISRAAAASVALAFGLTLSACGDNSSEASDAPPTNISADNQGDQAGDQIGDQADNQAGDQTGDPGDADRPDNLSNFPLPDQFTVVTSGANGSAWTAVLKVPQDWTEIRDLYLDGLVGAGWTIVGHHPLRDENSIQYDATKDDMEATVAISSTDGATDMMINVVTK